MNLLGLLVKIGVKDEASGKAKSISSSIKSDFASAASAAKKATAAAFAATTAAVGAATGAFVKGVSQVAEYGDNIDKMSQKMGMSAEAYQEWDAVMQHSGTSMETMKASMKTLANAAETGNEAFQRIGLTQEQIASMSQEELFAATIEGLQNIDNETERTYLAGQLLGRGATELGALLNTSAEDTQAMRDRVHELGGVMSDEAVKAAAAFQDSLQDTKTAIGGLKRSVFAEFMPAITQVMDGLQEIFTGNYDEGFAKISEGVDNAVAKIAEIAPKALEIGGKIMSAIAQAFVNNAPELITALLTAFTGAITQLATMIPTIIQTLVPVIIEFTPVILEAGIQLFLGLLQALVKVAPQIVDGLVALLETLIDKLPEYLPQLIAVSMEFFQAIALALLQKSPEILALLGRSLIDMVWNVSGRAGDMLRAGLDLIGGLLDGVKNKISELPHAIWEGIKAAVYEVTNFSWDMYNAGASIISGLADGIRAGFSNAISAVTGGLSMIRSYLPFSPAKRGPFSGQGWTLYSGMSMMEALGDGIREKTSGAVELMESAMSGIRDAASKKVVASVNVSAIGRTPVMAHAGANGLTLAGDAVAAAPTVNLYINDARVNDDGRIEQLFRDLMYEFVRKGGM